jgi:hypothetical protein
MFSDSSSEPNKYSGGGGGGVPWVGNLVRIFANKFNGWNPSVYDKGNAG